MHNKKIVLSADGATAVITDASIVDIALTMIAPDTAVTGTYGLIQKGAFVGLGMAIQNNRLGRGWNPISAA